MFPARIFFAHRPLSSLLSSSRFFFSTSTPLSDDDIIHKVESSDHNKVKLAVVDIDGVLRGKYISKDKFLSSAKTKMGFCSVIFGWDIDDKLYENNKFVGWHTGYPDFNATIDLQSYRTVPWENDIPFFLVDFEHEENMNLCPRKLLKKVQKQAKEEYNAKVICGPELEFYNFAETTESINQKNFQSTKPFTPGMFGYSLLRTGQNHKYFQALFDESEKFGINVEGLHCETGPGVLETAITCDNPLRAADSTVLFKYAAKIIGSRLGVMPCFMAKPYSDLPGTSGHIHQSFVSLDNGKNLFYNKDDEYLMSDFFKHYVAGQLQCMPEILPMFCPTVNSYKRLVSGFWAPVDVTWGVENRTTSLRVIPGSEKSTRIETRIPGADANNYLAISAALAAGMYGVRNKLELPQDTKGESKSGIKLSTNLLDATEKMKNSAIAVELFGSDFVEHFTSTREWEWREFYSHFTGKVTQWEIKRYFENI